MTYNTEIKLDEQSGDYYIELNDELLAKLDWKTGDQLYWENQENGTIKITKIINHE